MNDRKTNRLVKKSLSISDLGRAGAGIEARMTKRERLKYYESGFIAGYKLAMRDVATLTNNNEAYAKRRYVDQCIADIQIQE